MSRTIYYLSVDGAMEPLGTSQVVRYLERLAPISRNRFVLVTLEKADHLADSLRVSAMRDRLARAGVRWIFGSYRFGAGGMPANVAVQVDAVLDSGSAENALVWARGYVSAFSARILQSIARIPYIFDTRGYWFDERLPAGGLFSNAAFYRAGKQIEKSLFRNASGTIGLTEMVLEDIESGVFGAVPEHPRVVVPTCASFEEFRPDAKLHSEAVEFGERGPVVGYIGSINTAYQVEASFDLFARLRRHCDAHLLCLTRQTDEAIALARRFSIPDDSVTVRSATHDEMPGWVAGLDYGLLIRGPSFAKRASMPTKLAEFFASGVRPIAYPCNSSVRHWVDRVGTGIILESAESAELDRAAKWASKERDKPSSESREIARKHFGLDMAIPRLNGFVEEVISEL